MNFTSYAELAVRLVNTDCPDHGHRDGLVSVDGYRAFTAGVPQLNSRVMPGDLEALTHLKADLRLIFTSAAAGKGEEVVERLNALLTRYPFHPEIAQHDGQSWHLHLAESGSAADKYAARAVVGLAGIVTQMGPERLGSCADAECQGVFIDASTNRSRRQAFLLRPVRGQGTGQRHGLPRPPAQPRRHASRVHRRGLNRRPPRELNRRLPRAEPAVPVPGAAPPASSWQRLAQVGTRGCPGSAGPGGLP